MAGVRQPARPRSSSAPPTTKVRAIPISERQRECYCNDVFLELETLSPTWELPPGEEVQHQERWELMAVDPGATPVEVAELIEGRKP